jgi:hypothetical protein
MAMTRRRFILTALAVAALAARATAQVAPTVKGSRDDLRGAKSVYVDTSYDHALRDALAAEIRKELPELTIAEAPEGADLILRFSRSVPDESDGRRGTWDEPPYSADQTMSRTPPPPRRPPLPTEKTSADEPDAPDSFDAPTRYAIGSVLKPVPGGPAREALSFKQPIRTKAEAAARDFARKFAREYRKANR